MINLHKSMGASWDQTHDPRYEVGHVIDCATGPGYVRCNIMYKNAEFC